MGRRLRLGGPVAFIAVSSLLTVVFFPGPLLAGAAGLLFGTALGTPTALVAATLGATLACLLSRFVAGDAVEELGGPRVRSLAAWVARRGFLSVLYARLAPGVPYNAVNYAVRADDDPGGDVRPRDRDRHRSARRSPTWRSADRSATSTRPRRWSRWPS